MPCRLRIDLDCLMILRASLKAVSPDEGCALLLGHSSPDPHVRFVWPCCNVWRPGFGGFSDAISGDGDQAPVVASRRSRFALDPLEQIAAQRWSRRRGWQVLGSAHSHPGGQPVPSALDRQWAACEGVMLIDAGPSGVRAWWLQGPGKGEPHKPVSALPMVVESDTTFADTVTLCADGPFLPLR